MSRNSLSFMLENGLNLSEVVTTGSVLHINEDYDEVYSNSDLDNPEHTPADIIGQPVRNFARLSEKMVALNDTGYVKKKIIHEGGGFPLHEGCTVSISYSGYWENENEPFDMVPLSKPMEVDLHDNGLLPGLQMALQSMLVGETSIFLLTYKVMYGELGIPPRIKPKTDCVFYIKVVKSILTLKKGKINYSEPNMFQRVHHEVKLLYSSGSTFYNSKNYMSAIQLFKKAVNMLHKCRLADEKEQQIQEKLLKKLYINLVVCYNKIQKPLKACNACNELNRLRSLWNNGKVLFQNAKALRMIRVYDEAERRLKKAMTYYPGNEDMKAEYDLLLKTWNASKIAKVNAKILTDAAISLVSEEFKREVDDLISDFKNNDEDKELIIPSYFNADEIGYFKEVCTRENLFFKNLGISELPNEEQNHSSEADPELPKHYVLQKREECNKSKDKCGRKEFVEVESDFV